MKKSVSVFLCLITVLCVMSFGMAVPASAADNSWSSAYKDFIDRKGYAGECTESSGVKFALRDIGGTDAPELIVADGHEGGTYGIAHIYSIINGEVCYVGNVMCYGSGYGAHYSEDENYPGLINYIWSREDTGFPNEVPFHICYEYLEGIELKFVDVAADYDKHEEYRNLCDDEELFNACVNAENLLTFVGEDEFISMSWTDFCKKYGVSVSDSENNAIKNKHTLIIVIEGALILVLLFVIVTLTKKIRANKAIYQ